MDDLDKKIRSALTPQNNELIGEPNEGLRIDQLMLSTFRTRNWFITAIAFVYTFVFFGLAIYSVVRFFAAEETKHLLAWGFGFSFCMLAVAMLKMWFWMEMQRLAMTREIKRVELLLARLLQQEGRSPSV